ncbi:CPBP family intramembrane metalloprotease [Aneurinibacillus sp. Ricciae_BoGa-3]|uniref:CPBP family intramembrane glutamic endopeptidase n=1 Tax=Aneurinibacillus sp. Ricciae_BoGa-3 TaxID=3022697 RepID=UPI002340643A|nr:CPBP family intramembrane glutamic endopeptidase [Aneurinibacillus sp. Ricciae_BoGa-3]WCK56040.1 CPBP family intramembrane metalloprotease [Aneurinibacillus sp. Ricciae_BoGa-3]
MDLQEKGLSQRVLLLNVYISQGILFVIGLLGVFVFYMRKGMVLTDLFSFGNIRPAILLGAAAAGAVVAAEAAMIRVLPPQTFDDGGLNELLFKGLPYWHIAFIALVVAFCEELLFRGVMQPNLGLWATSALFALIHVRYLKKWVMFVTVLTVSLLLGWLYNRTGSIWSVITAHFLIDFILGCFSRNDWFIRKKEGF